MKAPTLAALVAISLVAAPAVGGGAFENNGFADAAEAGQQAERADRATIAQARPAAGRPAAAAPGADKTMRVSLEECVRLALEKNLSVQIASLRRDALEPEIRRAEAIFHPTFGVTAEHLSEKVVIAPNPATRFERPRGVAFVSQQLPTGGTVVVSMDVFREDPNSTLDDQAYTTIGAVTVVQPLLRGGRIFVATRPIRDAEFNHQAEEARFRAQVLAIAAQAKIGYLNAVLAERIIDVTQTAIGRSQALVESSGALLRAQRVTVRDVLDAAIRLAEDSERLVRAKTDLDNAKNLLRDTLGVPLGVDLDLAEKDIGFAPVRLEEERWIAAALQNRPEIAEAQTLLAQSDLNVRVADNGILPQLNLVGSYARRETNRLFGQTLDPDGYSWNVGLVFSIPIGNVAAEAALTRANVEHSRLRHERIQRERLAEGQVRAAVIKLRNSEERQRSLQAVVEQNRRLEQVARDRFSLGLASNLDVTKSQKDLRDAEIEFMRATVDYNIGLAELEAAVGGPIL